MNPDLARRPVALVAGPSVVTNPAMGIALLTGEHPEVVPAETRPVRPVPDPRPWSSEVALVEEPANRSNGTVGLRVFHVMIKSEIRDQCDHRLSVQIYCVCNLCVL